MLYTLIGSRDNERQQLIVQSKPKTTLRGRIVARSDPLVGRVSTGVHVPYHWQQIYCNMRGGWPKVCFNRVYSGLPACCMEQ
jgi:hypothetical protein